MQLVAIAMKKNVLDLNIEVSHLIPPKVKVAVKRYATAMAIAIAATQNNKNLISFDIAFFINSRFSPCVLNTTVDFIRQLFRIFICVINYA